LESLLPSFFVYAPKDNPDQDIQAVRSLYRSIQTGAFATSEDSHFYVLGLSPNAARISVRFWHMGKVSEFAQRIKAHFDDLEIARPSYEQRYALFYLICEIAQQGKMENTPPNLAGDVMRAILEGLPYPAQIMQQTIRRIRATQMVNSYRAAWLKAYLNRKRRLSNNHSFREITVALDKENNNPGYRLGRLFAALEKIQEEAQPGINATIRDRFYGSASTSPVTVFSQLLKLKNHHLAKLENPAFKVAHEKRLAEIFDPIKAFPAHLSMEQQAQFAIGYYHQRQDFFKKKNNGETTSQEA
jgi:CRISPR-associated protein Csd1